MTPGVLSPQASSGRSLGLLVSEAEQSQASSRSRSSDELTPARASHKTSPGISPPRLAPHLSHPLRGQFLLHFFFIFFQLNIVAIKPSTISTSVPVHVGCNFWNLLNSH